jgi:hypothetical protein
MKKFWGIEIHSGVVVYDDISFLKDYSNLALEVDYLKEDMLQIHFPEKMIIDVGWCPSFDLEGAFFAYLIMNEDWQNPIEQVKSSNIKELKVAINKFVEKIISMNSKLK